MRRLVPILLATSLATACSAGRMVHGGPCRTGSVCPDGGDDGGGLGADGSGDDGGGTGGDGGTGDDGGGSGGDLGITGADGGSIYDVDGGDGGMIVADRCPASSIVPTGCLTAIADESGAGLCNQLDDDCDGQIDEGCSCTGGAVQPCFRGPPGRRHVGACADGMQQCLGTSEFGHWGDCMGGIAPSAEACDGLDNDCNGCTDEVAGCIPMGMCPAPGDVRTPDGTPFTDYHLHGGDFFSGSAAAWMWTVQGGPCDMLPGVAPTYTLTGATSMEATFHPSLSGDYTVTLTVLASDGTTFTCTWIVHILAPGLRIEMCYPESNTQDLDLFLSQPGYSGNWYVDTVDAFAPAQQACGWHDCEATIRGTTRGGAPYARASWGYASSALPACNSTPHGLEWTLLGSCSNPRLDVDNNLSEGIGLPENINVDDPPDAARYRVMVQNFTGTVAHPIVNVYCGGHRVATYGAASGADAVAGYAGTSGYSGIGAMWRVVDVTTHLDASGTTTCDVAPVHPPATPTSGYDVTFDNPRF